MLIGDNPLLGDRENNGCIFPGFFSFQMWAHQRWIEANHAKCIPAAAAAFTWGLYEFPAMFSVCGSFFLDLSLQLSSQLSGRLCPSANTQVTQVLEKLMRCPESPKRNSLTGLCNWGTSARHASDVFNTRVHVLYVGFNSLICSGRGLHWVLELR